MTDFDHLATLLLERLVWTSLQAAVLVGVVALLLRLRPNLSAATRCTLWWLVGLQALLGLCWHAPVRLPLLAPATIAGNPGLIVEHGAATGSVVPLPPAPTAAIATSPAIWLITLWLLLLLAQLPGLLRQHHAARQLRRNAIPATDHVLLAQCEQQARSLGLRRMPQLLVSTDIDSPQVSGYLRPVVLWPARQVLKDEEAGWVLAHELAHLQRGDLLLGWVPALAQRLFFFHPLLRRAMREYAIQREAACDAQVLQQGHAMPQDYGRLLLRLGVAAPGSAGLAGASPTFHHLKRRLTMLQQTMNPPPSRLRSWLLVAAIALVGVLPYRVTAADAGADVPSTGIVQFPPAPPAPPAPPPTPTGPHTTHTSFSLHDHSAEGFVLLDGGSFIVSGSDADMTAAKRLQRNGKSLLWFRRGDKSWLVDDPAYVKRAAAAYAPISDLGREQGQLGGRQGELGGEQGALGARQGALGASQGRLAGQRAALAGQRAALAAQTDTLARTAERSRLDAREEELDREEARLSREQDELARQQTELSRKQEALSSKQAMLSQRQQQASQRANQQLAALLDEAIAKGVARPAGS